MSLADLLRHYGYFAVFFGTFVEGESMVTLGGYAAHRGYLELPWVIASAIAAAVASDQLYFLLGRRHGERLLARWPRWQAKVAASMRLVERHSVAAVFGMRFMWGLRVAIPFAIGMSNITALRYFALNVASVAVWACLVASIGFGGSRVLARLIDDLHRHERWIVAGLVLIAVAVVVRRWWPFRGRRVDALAGARSARAERE